MLSDLGGEALLGLVMPLRLLLSRLGAALDLGKIAAAAGERFFRERFGPAAGGLFGLLGLALRRSTSAMVIFSPAATTLAGVSPRVSGRRADASGLMLRLQQIDSQQDDSGHDWRK